ncbi:hypothetical protein CONCODRAFT_79394 [Conidiobolus coronatus NRRL 28638]|uniref:Phosphatidylethanolamine N-methyltransferase n=1 Tax=Conidiobolus coronatus (strain ATCC 28846 / CBS 209.66 / NRRL 28638) TaxID=796925 RepID=A0A137P322_CONC2|nr:hypothetical protein CONCODRAFT_79394 [Conidiobolus coronatus NRRL 28638]|eukprot:KXN69304.1 hypothetical protein CONCODRAFT_79394 [Conidiobolus coronatus NRRL 28638]
MTAELEAKNDPNVLYGKTAKGKVFKVPKTEDVLNHLFSTQPKSFGTLLTLFVLLFEIPKSFGTLLTLFVLLFEIVLFLMLPTTARKWVFLFFFVFWRLAYNVGLGYLLHIQKTEMGEDYDYHQVPIEFNSWLIYRYLVDLILVNDFASYIILALTYWNLDLKSSWYLNFLRYFGGIILVWFNLIVKIDAYRVVKDFAWYWGDFFFLVQSDLTFDGVFEIAPHPMYSIGYAAYYGISLMSASYTVFYCSLFAHFLQFVFLHFVENPHIDKIYNKPPAYPSNTASISVPSDEHLKPDTSSRNIESSESDASYPNSIHSQQDDISETYTDSNLLKRTLHRKYFQRDMVGLTNLDWFRSSDLFSMVLISYGIGFPLLGWWFNFGSLSNWKYFSLLQAFIWRVLLSFGLNIYVLTRQSKEKWFTKHFIKYGGTSKEAFTSWKSLQNLTTILAYSTFALAAFFYWDYSALQEFNSTAFLRCVFGVMLILIHFYTSNAVYEVIGEYGWFFGDFFIDQYPNELKQHGVYRYLSNPSNIMGHMSLWGIALISHSFPIYFLAFFSHFSYLIFFYQVEKPHMAKIYGIQSTKRDGGISKKVKSVVHIAKDSLIIKLKEWDAWDSVTNSLQVLFELIDKMIDEVNSVAKELQKEGLGRLAEVERITNLSINKLVELLNHKVQNFSVQTIHVENPTLYKLELVADIPSDKTGVSYELGEPIHIQYSLPKNTANSPFWVGVYPIDANNFSHITSVSSTGKYLFTRPEDDPDHSVQELSEFYDEAKLSISSECSGKVLKFSNSRLPWAWGTFEFRLHLGSSHQCIARSQPFTVSKPKKISSRSDESDIAQAILPLIHLSFDQSIESQVDQAFVEQLWQLGLTDEVANRVSKIVEGKCGFEIDPYMIKIEPDFKSFLDRIKISLDELEGVY